MALSEIVSVQIQLGTVNPARTGFGVPLILTQHSRWAGNLVRTYTSFAGVAADFLPGDMAYRAAQKIFSQPRRVRRVKIGRLAPPSSGQRVVLDFTDHPTGTAIVGSIEIAGVSTAISVAWNTNIATTLAALDTAIELVTGAASVTTASPLCTVAIPSPFIAFANYSFPTAHVRETTLDQGIDVALTAAAILDGDFYGVILDTNSPRNLDKAARWCLANERLLFSAPQYTKPNQFVSGEFAAGADYTALLANNSAIGLFTAGARSNFAEAAWVGLMFSYPAGSATYAFKSLAGTGADAFTSTQRTEIEAVKGNHYTNERNVGITRPGKAFGGQWIDVVIGLASTIADISEDLFALLLSEPKVPYTDEGIGQINASVRGSLRSAELAGIIAPGWTTIAAPASEQSEADRGARVYNGLTFEARLQGAIHEIVIAGTVTA